MYANRRCPAYLLLQLDFPIDALQPRLARFHHFDQPIYVLIVVLDKLFQQAEPRHRVRVERREQGREDGQDVFFVFQR